MENAVARDFVAGVVGGVSGIIAGHPLDTVKVRMQVRPAGTYRGLFHCFTSLVRKEGVTAMYKGLVSPVLGCAPVNAVLFVSYGALSRWMLGEEREELSLGEVLVAGSGAGVATAIVTTVADLIKVQLQNQTTTYDSAGKKIPKLGNIGMMRAILKHEGPTGFLRGFVPTLWRETPSFGLYFAAYEGLRRQLLPEDGGAYGAEDQWRYTMVTLTAGGVGGTLAWVSTYPFDIVKSKVQGQLTNEPMVYKGMVDCFKQVWRKEGVAGFTRGLSACITRGFPVNAVTFLMYELSLRALTPEGDDDAS